MALAAIILGLSASSPTFAGGVGDIATELGEQELARELSDVKLERIETALPYAQDERGKGHLIHMPGMTIGVRQAKRGLADSDGFVALRAENAPLAYQIEQEASALEASVSYGLRFGLAAQGYEVVLHPDDVQRWSSDRGDYRGNPEVNQGSMPEPASLMAPVAWLEWSLSLHGAVTGRYLGFLVSDVTFRLNVELLGAHPGTNFGAISVYVKGRQVSMGPSGRQYTFVVLPPAIDKLTDGFATKMAELVGETKQYLERHHGFVIGRTSDGFAIVALGRDDGLVGSHEGNKTPGSRVRVGEYEVEVYVTAHTICLLAPLPVEPYQTLLTQNPPVTVLNGFGQGMAPAAGMGAAEPGWMTDADDWREKLAQAQPGQFISLPGNVQAFDAQEVEGTYRVNIPESKLGVNPHRGQVVQLVPPVEEMTTGGSAKQTAIAVVVGPFGDGRWQAAYLPPRRLFTADWWVWTEADVPPPLPTRADPDWPAHDDRPQHLPHGDDAPPPFHTYEAFLNAVAKAELGTVVENLPKFTSGQMAEDRVPADVYYRTFDASERYWEVYIPGMVGSIQTRDKGGLLVQEHPTVVMLYTAKDYQGERPEKPYLMHVWVLTAGGKLPPLPAGGSRKLVFGQHK